MMTLGADYRMDQEDQRQQRAAEDDQTDVERGAGREASDTSSDAGSEESIPEREARVLMTDKEEGDELRTKEQKSEGQDDSFQKQQVEKVMGGPPTYPITLFIQNLSLKITTQLPRKNFFVPGKKLSRTILSDVNLTVHPGELLAVMGPTGCGKSTLLNVIGGRIKSGVTGQVLFNDQPRTKPLKHHISYVLQDDVMFPGLTVEETLKFAALLKIPQEVSEKEKLERMNALIELLGLTKCRNTIVGDPARRGVSGGERKRVNIGNEIVTGPSIILLDEPTSGLDSYTAEMILRSLSLVAKETKRTVITTIHQPSSKIFEMFDKLLLMVDGKIVYFGQAADALDYFESLGFHCPRNYNPADFMLELLVGGDSKQRLDQKATRELLVKAYAEREGTNGGDGEDVEKGLKSRESSRKSSSGSRTSERGNASLVPAYPNNRKYPVNWWLQTSYLLQRSFLLQRGRIFDPNPFIQVISVAILAGLLWLQLPDEESRIRDRTSVIFFIAVFAGGFVPLLTGLFSFPSERGVVNKERASGAYQMSPYFIAKNISEIPLQLVYPTIFVAITYWMVGLNSDPGRFFSYLGLVLLANFTSMSLGLLLGALFVDMAFGSLMASVVMLSLMLVGGFYVQLITLEWWIRWTQYLSFLRFLYYALLKNDLRGETFKQQPIVTQFDGLDPIRGDEILQDGRLGLEQEPLDPWAYALIILGYGLAFRFLAYLAVRFMHRPKAV